MRTLTIVVIYCAASLAQAEAQVTVQQPVFEVFGTTTTVSVPDRGSAHLGSISRGAASRKSFGPFRSGTNTGVDHSHSTSSVSVYIHDFAAMDAYLLNQGGPSAPSVSGRSGHAYRQLSRPRSQMRASLPPDPADVRRAAAPVNKADKYLKLGEAAEKRNSLSVARLHYKVAAKYGSQAAAARLRSLDSAVASQ